MLTPKDILGNISGGRVLDVATGGGGFIPFLLEGLKDYSEIIGIDTNERGRAAFSEAFKAHSNIHFEPMDALHPAFAPASFDLVCISNSLHHFADPAAVLQPMLRLLRPGGHFLLSEMYCDGQTETQLTHVELHHWWGAVDRLTNLTHNPTYTRAGLVAWADSLGLVDLKLFDLCDLDEDPHQAEILDELNPVIARYIQRADGHPDLQQRGEELRQRVQTVGFHSASTLVALGTKP